MNPLILAYVIGAAVFIAATILRTGYAKGERTKIPSWADWNAPTPLVLALAWPVLLPIGLLYGYGYVFGRADRLAR